MKKLCIYNLVKKFNKLNGKNFWCKPYYLLNELQVGNNKMMCAHVNLTNCLLPGTVVSMWKYSQQNFYSIKNVSYN